MAEADERSRAGGALRAAHRITYETDSQMVVTEEEGGIRVRLCLVSVCAYLSIGCAGT
jgi:hypothetical protein